MIDWWVVFSNGLWIIGLSIVLAAFSYHDWLATAARRPRREAFATRAWRLSWTGGMTLVSVGWLLSQTTHVWQQVVLGVLAVWFAWAWFTAVRDAGPPAARHDALQ